MAGVRFSYDCPLHYVYYLVENPEGKRSLGRPRRTWEENIKMDVREVGCDAGDWIDLIQDRVSDGLI